MKYLIVVLFSFLLVSPYSHADDSACLGMQMMCNNGCFGNSNPYACMLNCKNKALECSNNADSDDYDSQYQEPAPSERRYQAKPGSTYKSSNTQSQGKIERPHSNTGNACVSASNIGAKRNTQIKPYCHRDFEGCFDKLHGASFVNNCDHDMHVVYSCGAQTNQPLMLSAGRSREVWIGEMRHGCRGNYSYTWYTYR